MKTRKIDCLDEKFEFILAARSGAIGNDTEISSDHEALVPALADHVETVFKKSGGRVGMND